MRLETTSWVRFLKVEAFESSYHQVGKDLRDSIPEVRAADSHVPYLHFLQNKGVSKRNVELDEG